MARKKRPLWARIFRSRLPEEETKKLDPTPLEMPFGCQQPTPLADLIARMVKEAVAVETGEDWETPEEADDFDVDDDDLLDMTPYELDDLQEQEPIEKPTVRVEPEVEARPEEAPQETPTPTEESQIPAQVE